MAVLLKLVKGNIDCYSLCLCRCADDFNDEGDISGF